jgi:hypothetical protein
MIRIACPSNGQELQSIVIAAFERSCGIGSVQSINYLDLKGADTPGLQSNSKHSILVLVSPPEECIPILLDILETASSKVVVFGVIPPLLAQFLNIKVRPISAKVVVSSECIPASIHQFSESTGYIKYIKGLNEDDHVLPSRALRRFDYSNEWNNLGFGAITTDGSVWSLCHCADVSQKNSLAYLMTDGEKLSTYCALWDYPDASLLWFNREVGPVDSYEWRLIENYIANYRFSDLPAWPILLEIPYGYDGAVTMRMDCDEDVESARALCEAYKEWGIPFSLALHASILRDSRQHQLPRDVINSGGAILSHTLSHAPNWGGSKEAAYFEGFESANIIESVSGIRPKYAVSPFHQTPIYAREGLALAGYKGCIGGIIANDPDFLMARGGRPPYSDQNFVGHTQQCMLHGDCLLSDGDSLRIFKRAFDLAEVSKSLFGFLDHPFSSRYQYGWKCESERIDAHKEFISYIRKKNKKYLFLNENQALDFIGYKMSIRVVQRNGKMQLNQTLISNPEYDVGIEFGGISYCVSQNGLVIK